MVRLALLASLGLSLSGMCSAAVVDGRDPLDGTTFASPADHVAPFQLSARNIITSKVEMIEGGINVNWTDSRNKIAARQCIVGEGPAYFPIQNIGYFATDACNAVMPGRHGNGGELQPPGTYPYLSPAYVQDLPGNPKVAVLVTLHLYRSVLNADATSSCLNMLSHFYDTSAEKGKEGWCVTRTEKHNMMTQGGKVQVTNQDVGKGQSGWEWFWGRNIPEILLELKVDPAKCTEDGDPCSNQHQIADSSLNNAGGDSTIDAPQYSNAGSENTPEVAGPNHDELKV
ncbi:MAG: hypothetical protein Q9210_006835 [Variospora velana]